MHFPSMLLAPNQRVKGDKELVFSYKCACSLKVELGVGVGGVRANTSRSLLGHNLIIFCCRCQADGAAWFLI